jgi:hypothetical protein
VPASHYLIVDPEKPSIVHHARATADTIPTRIVTEGDITLDPPGIAFGMVDIYGASETRGGGGSAS